MILGSSSKFRARLLREAGYDFEIMKPDINEKAVGGSRSDLNADASEIALAVANAKADALLAKIDKDAILLTLDQVVTHNGTIREKPKDPQECIEYLKSYEFGPAQTHSALVLVHLKTGNRVSGVDVARQHFKKIPDSVIKELIEQGDVLHCAGGFMIDSGKFHLIPRFNSSLFKAKRRR